VNVKRIAAVVAAAFVATAFAQDKAKAPAAKPTEAKAEAPMGKAAGAAVKLTATVEAIDQATRSVTLKGEKGNVLTFTAGPEVKNLAQVQKGDIVTLEYAEAVAVELKKSSAATPSRSESEMVKTAKPGEKPAAVAARQVTVVAKVEAIDEKNSMVTLRGPKQTVDLKVKDPAILKQVKVGDNVEAAYVEAVAIKVEKAPAPAKAPAKK
jgi:Cu/Ag efflux protein CusF